MDRFEEDDVVFRIAWWKWGRRLYAPGAAVWLYIASHCGNCLGLDDGISGQPWNDERTLCPGLLKCETC